MREIISFAAYALFAGAGAVAIWSLRRDLATLWRWLNEPRPTTPCTGCGRPTEHADGLCEWCWWDTPGA